MDLTSHVFTQNISFIWGKRSQTDILTF